MPHRQQRFPIGIPLAFAVLLLTDCAIALTPAVHDAREMARRAVCTNNLSAPSYPHDSADCVFLDRDWNITEVSSCPCCAVPEGFPFLVAKFYREGPGFEPIPQSMVPEAIQQAVRARLDEYKRADWYRQRRDRFSPRSASQPIATGPTPRGC
jgi:hypothetical protein